jgi:nitrogen fixation protein NifU and related proteins
MIEELYRETVVDHYRRPRNRRRLESPTVAHAGENPFCGDRVEIGLRIDGDRIAAASTAPAARSARRRRRC